MSTSAKSNAKMRRAYVPTTALAKTVEFADEMMQVHLTDGRILAVPILWFPRLHEATPEQRNHYELGSGGASLHWPELDEDLTVAGMMAGADRQSA